MAEFSKYFVIVGGEPLLRDDIFELFEYAHMIGLPCSIITKGTTINRKQAVDMATMNVNVNIALDAMTPNACDQLSQCNGVFDKTKEAIDICHEFGILQGITCTLTKQNAKETFDVLDFAASIGAEGCWMSLRPLGHGKHIYNDYALTKDEYEKYLHAFFHQADEVSKKTGLYFHVYDPIYSRILVQHNVQALKICGLGKYLNVDAEGNVIACLFTDLHVGNIREKSIKEIWLEVISDQFFQKIHDPTNLKGACGECRYNSICGGCRARAFQLTGDWFASDPACYYTMSTDSKT